MDSAAGRALEQEGGAHPSGRSGHWFRRPLPLSLAKGGPDSSLRSRRHRQTRRRIGRGGTGVRFRRSGQALWILSQRRTIAPNPLRWTERFFVEDLETGAERSLSAGRMEPVEGARRKRKNSLLRQRRIGRGIR